MTNDSYVHYRGRPPAKPLEPLNDLEFQARRAEDEATASDALLAALIKHHPEHERPVAPKRLIHPRKTP